MAYTTAATWEGPLQGHQLLENSYAATTTPSSGSTNPVETGDLTGTEPWIVSYSVRNYLRAYTGLHIGSLTINLLPQSIWAGLSTETEVDEETGDETTTRIPAFLMCELTLPYRPERPQNSLQFAIELASTDTWRIRPRDSILEGMTIYLEIAA